MNEDCNSEFGAHSSKATLPRKRNVENILENEDEVKMI